MGTTPTVPIGYRRPMMWLVNSFSLNMLRDPSGARLSVRELDEVEAREIAREARSAIGHADTAARLERLLAIPVATHRASIEVGAGDSLLVAQLRGPRLAEGATTLPEDARIVWLLVQVEAGPTDASSGGDQEATSSAVEPRAGEPVAPGAPPTTEPTQAAAPANAAPPVAAAAPDVELIAPVAARPDTRARRDILLEITKASAWNEPARAARERAALLARFPGAVADADAAEKDGRDQASSLAELERIARVQGPTSPAFDAQASKVLRRWPFFRRKVDRIRVFVEVAQANAVSGHVGCRVLPQHDNRVLALAPSKRWTVLVDETGDNFTEVGAPGQAGRFVAIVLPEDTRLPALARGFHTAHQTDEARDKALQGLLDAKVGIFGVSLRDLPLTPGERWVDGVLELVDWLLLLLPRPAEGEVQVDVRVEARGVYAAGTDWGLAVREILRRHAVRDPASVADLELTIATFAKMDEPLLAYADLVAHTWGSTDQVAKARLKASRLRGSCLLDGNVPALRDLWSGLSRDRALSPDQWAQLVATPGSDEPRSIAGALSDRLTDRARGQGELWHQYLDRTLAHIESKAIDLRQLGRQIAWLDEAAPEAVTLPVVARHAWALARLDAANHLGQVASDAEAELHDLGALLLDERAPMVCEADLRRAVIATNRFDFVGARAALARWHEVDPRVPGLQMWGRVQSSLGQHHAFEGRLAEARARFDAAIDAFGRLSDPRVRAGEQRHTGTYRAIAAMDDATVSDADARVVLEHVLGPLDEAVRRLSLSVADADKYALHLLLRWAFQRGDTALRARLVADAPRWEVGVGHPWPLVCLYRALLLEKTGTPDAVRAVLQCGLDLAWAPEQGPTVRFIGLVIAAVLAAKGRRDVRIPSQFDGLRAMLPCARDRLTRIEQALSTPGNLHDLINSSLPFNFR